MTYLERLKLLESYDPPKPDQHAHHVWEYWMWLREKVEEIIETRDDYL